MRRFVKQMVNNQNVSIWLSQSPRLTPCLPLLSPAVLGTANNIFILLVIVLSHASGHTNYHDIEKQSSQQCELTSC